MINSNCSNKGSGLVEVIVSSSLIAVIAIAFYTSFSTLSRIHKKDMLTIKAQLLAEEGVEALRLVRDSGWTNISSLPVDQVRYFSLGLSSWVATTTPELIDGIFNRSFVLHEAHRQGVNGPLRDTGGVIDTDTFLADVSVSWLWNNATTTITYNSYVIKM